MREIFEILIPGLLASILVGVAVVVGMKIIHVIAHWLF